MRATSAVVPRAASARPARRLTRWWLDRSVLVKGLTVVAIPMLALMAVTGAGLGVQMQERSERAIAVAANQVTGATRAVLADAIDAETGMRGYAATADPRFLAPYSAALTRMAGDLRAMQQAAVREHLQPQADGVTATVTEQLALLARLRSTVAAGAAGPELAAPLTEAQVVMDRLRVRVAALADAPARLVAQKRKAITRLEDVIESVQWAGLGLGVLAGLAGVGLFTSGISRRVRVAAGNAELLGQGEPLQPSTPAADELGELSESLTRANLLLESRRDELVAARDQAVQAIQAKNSFLSRTSHELRTPLNAILGFARLLQMSDLDDDDRDSAARIDSAGQHLLGLINELIDTALIEAGELRLSVEPVSVRRLTQDVADLIEPLAVARAISIEHDFAGDRLAVYADDQRLRQVLVNLASNAVKYNRHGGTIAIGFRPHGEDTIDITVSDTGAGLTPEQIKQIFLPFERLGAEQRGIEGTGMGLPLALGLTEAMHGQLKVVSNAGVGSTFTVRMPRAADIDPSRSEDDPRTTSAERGHPVLTEPLEVLSIEDNSANRDMLDRLFQRWPSITLYAAATGFEGIELACRRQPDLILLDLHLPDLYGEGVIARLRAEPATAHIPVVAVSADATPASIRRVLTSGASAYLIKPIDVDELARTIAQAAGVRAATAGARVTGGRTDA